MIVTLAELCRMPGMPSQPSVRRLVAARLDFPVLTIGSKGGAYRFDLDEAVAFIAAHWRDGRNERRRLRLSAQGHGHPLQFSLFDGDEHDQG